MNTRLSNPLTLLFAIFTLFFTTSCSNETYELNIGEIQQINYDYRNDDNIKDIDFMAEGSNTTMSAMQIRAIWHAIIINANDNSVYIDKSQNLKNTYESAIEAEQAFSQNFANSISLLKEQYAHSHEAIIQELSRANVHTYIKYIWCAQGNEYVNMKFKAELPQEKPME